MIHSGSDAAVTASESASQRLSDDALSGLASFASEVNGTGATGASATGSAIPVPTAPTATAPVSSTVPAPVETTLPTQNVASHAAVVPTPTTSAPPPPPTTTTSTAPPAGSVHYGQVTYYDHPAGRCASPFLPFGTVVRVTNPANGASLSCVVDDREADTARSIDLATSSFALLAPLSQGVIDAQLSW